MMVRTDEPQDRSSGVPRIEPAACEWRLVDGEVIGLDLRTEEYFAIRGSGVELWQRMADGATEQELVDLLCERVDADPERARADVAAFLATLYGRRLVRP